MDDEGRRSVLAVAGVLGSADATLLDGVGAETGVVCGLRGVLATEILFPGC